ncbi:MAG: helix-turn-helix domain-containing protein [Acidiphilium sp.]|nr:helix-turn-helix domain-containing protein [Acidiphilium sp.]
MRTVIPDLCAKCEARHIGLCDSLCDEDLHFLANVGRQTTIAKGHGFVTEGDPARHFFNINRGTAKLYKDLPDGRRQITGFAGSGDFIGLAADTRYAFSAEAIEDVHLCRFDRTDLRAVFGRFPVIERRLLDVASHELIIAQEQMLLLGRKTAIERLASFLEVWHQRAAASPGQTQRLTLPMTRGDLADYLGLTIETVSRALSALRKQGVIAVAADHGVSVLQPARLAGIAQTVA